MGVREFRACWALSQIAKQLSDLAAAVYPFTSFLTHLNQQGFRSFRVACPEHRHTHKLSYATPPPCKSTDAESRTSRASTRRAMSFGSKHTSKVRKPCLLGVIFCLPLSFFFFLCMLFVIVSSMFSEPISACASCFSVCLPPAFVPMDSTKLHSSDVLPWQDDARQPFQPPMMVMTSDR